MGDDSERYGYEVFAGTEENLTVNNAIIAKWVDRMRDRRSRNIERVLDLATSVGTMVTILLNTLPRRKRPREVVCVDMSEQAGFKVEELEQVEARLYRSTVEKISSFSQYAAGALHGYPTDAAAEAMRDAVAASIEEHGVCDERNERYIPRYWLSAVARAT